MRFGDYASSRSGGFTAEVSERRRVSLGDALPPSSSPPLRTAGCWKVDKTVRYGYKYLMLLLLLSVVGKRI